MNWFTNFLRALFGRSSQPTRWTLWVKVQPADASAALSTVNNGQYAGAVDGSWRVFNVTDPLTWPATDAVLTVAADGYITQTIPINVGRVSRQVSPVVLLPDVPVIEVPDQLHVDGTELRHADGRAYFGLGISAFPLLKAAVEQTPDLLPFLDYCQKYGLFPRAFGSYDNQAFGRFVPADYGFAFVRERLHWLAGECSRRGLRLKLSVLADRNRSQDLASMDPQVYLNLCADALRDWPNTFLDTGNEYEHNGWDPQAFMEPNHPLVGRGSNGAGIPPANPWDYFDQHGRRDREWKIGLKDIYGYQTGSDGAFVGAKPGGDDEPISISENRNDDGKKCVTNPDDVYEFIATPFGSYVVLHVRAGMRLQVPGPVATACVEAARQAAKDFPAEWRSGTYVRGGGGGINGFGLVDSPQTADNGSIEESHPDWWHRAYGRLRGDEQWITIVRHTEETNVHHERLNAELASRLQALPGWRIAELRGRGPDRPSIVRLVRR